MRGGDDARCFCCAPEDLSHSGHAAPSPLAGDDPRWERLKFEPVPGVDLRDRFRGGPW
jgi:hypothetical protein